MAVEAGALSCSGFGLGLWDAGKCGLPTSTLVAAGNLNPRGERANGGTLLLLLGLPTLGAGVSWYKYKQKASSARDVGTAIPPAPGDQREPSRGGGAAAESTERLPCPTCGKTYKTQATLRVHMAKQHGHEEEASHACTICDRKFPTSSGRGQHMRRAHPEAHAAEVTSALNDQAKRRWDPDEIRMMVNLEADLVRQGKWSAVEGHQKMKEMLPHRSIDGIKGQRRSAAYKEKLREVIARSGESPSETPRSEDNEGLEEDENGTDGSDHGDEVPVMRSEEARETIKRHLMSLPKAGERAKWREGELDKIIETVVADEASANEIEDALDRYVETLPVPTRAARKMKEEKKLGRKTKIRGGRPWVPTESQMRRTRRHDLFRKLKKLWRTRRSRCAKLILSGNWRADLEPGSDEQPISPEDMEGFWGRLFSQPSTPDERPVKPNQETHWGLLAPMKEEEIERRRKTMDVHSAAGPDGITVRLLRAMPISALGKLYNLMLWMNYVPKALRHSRTTLIPKVPKPSEPSQHRPISVTSVVLRGFTGILAERCSATCKISEYQRAFQPTDGCCENILTLDNLIHRARRREFPLAIALIDVAKAFDSVSHATILGATARLGVPDQLIRLIRSLYTDATTEIRKGAYIQLKRGVRQGDPLSPFLFNAVVDQATEPVAQDAEGEDIPGFMAFADDLILVARTPQRLQQRLNMAVEGLGKAGLKVNAAKCAAMIIRQDGKHKRAVIDQSTEVTVAGDRVRALGPTDRVKYLGVSVGFHGTRFEPETPLSEGIRNIREAPLKPQQKLFILTAHLLPAQYHRMVFGRVTGGELRKADVMVREAVRAILKLPKDTATPFFHAAERDGGLGVPELRAQIPALKIKRTEALKDSSHPYAGKIVESGYIKDFRERVKPVVQHGVRLDTKDKIRDAAQKQLVRSADGYGLKEAPEAPATTLTWVTDGVVRQTGAAFVGAVHVRGGLVATPARLGRANEGREVCDAGCQSRPTLAHILQTCPRTWGPRIARHDAVVKHLAARLKERGYEVDVEPSIRTPAGLRKPDIVARKGSMTTVLDAQIVSDGHPLEEANNRKKKHYDTQEVLEEVKRKEGRPEREVQVMAATMNWRGIWCKRSAEDMKKLGITATDLRTMAIRVVEKGKKMATFWHRATSRGGSRRRREYDGRPP